MGKDLAAAAGIVGKRDVPVFDVTGCSLQFFRIRRILDEQNALTGGINAKTEAETGKGEQQA